MPNDNDSDLAAAIAAGRNDGRRAAERCMDPGSVAAQVRRALKLGFEMRQDDEAVEMREAHALIGTLALLLTIATERGCNHCASSVDVARSGRGKWLDDQEANHG